MKVFGPVLLAVLTLTACSEAPGATVPDDFDQVLEAERLPIPEARLDGD